MLENMNKKWKSLLLVAFAGAGMLEAKPDAAGSPLVKPNVIVFYVDDLGWQDVPLNKLGDPCPYEMPNLEKLAASGMNFTQAYASAPSCSPSRAGLLTGQHPAKIWMTHVWLGKVQKGKHNAPLVEPYLDAHLNLDLLTIADAMKQNGYRTGHVGKWHVGLDASKYGFDFVDHTRGFHRGMNDRTKDFATPNGKDYPLSKKKYPPVSEKNPEGISYPYDQLTESALEFMDENCSEPFFLNFWHWMVHWPVLTRNGELLEYYCDKLGYPFPPEAGDMTREGQQNPYFAAMVTSVDWSLGRVVEFLKKTDDPRNPGKKLIETTYIFFSSDNGGAERHGKEVISDNFPLKHGKTYTEEGGIRVPMVVAGPGVPAASTFHKPVNQLDYFPTLLELSNSKIAAEHMRELSGLDLSSVLKAQSKKLSYPDGSERKFQFWHFPHNHWRSMKSAIREGDFKLYNNHSSGAYELYRLYKQGKLVDLEEKNDISQDLEYQPVLERLSANLDAALFENKARGPYLNPDYTKKGKGSAKLTAMSFKSSKREARVQVSSDGPAITEAYVLYHDKSAVRKSKGKRGAHGKEAIPLERVKIPATIAEDGYSASAEIPAKFNAYSFIIIDTNNYLTHSEVKLVE